MKTILVTGAAGFIGSHVCETLLQNGADVVGIDNFSDYYSPRYKRENIEEIKAADKDGNFLLLEGDIRDETFLDRVFALKRPDLVIHLAACAGVRPSIIDPVLYMDVNINGTVNILEHMKKYEVKQYVFASSSSVYGNNKKLPFAESDAVDRPISPYAATKKSGEIINYSYHHLYDINTACLRFFTVYGPRQRPDLAIYKFTKYVLEGCAIPFYGDGSSSRDYTYINDIVDGVLKAADWVFGPSKRFDIFNLGGNEAIDLNRMILCIESAVGKKAVRDMQPAQPGDVNTTYADISHSREILGYQPTVKFEEGVKRFVAWYRANRRDT